MKTSINGIRLIKQFEGCRLEAYKCPAGRLTIGYGHTGSDVKVGMKINQAQATALLIKDVAKFEKIINETVKVKLNQNQFDALVSFVYNVGGTKFKKSTMLKFINAGHFPLAAGQFDLWIKSKGKVLAGLVKRRKAEKELFLK